MVAGVHQISRVKGRRVTIETPDLTEVWARVLDTLADEAGPQAGAFLKLTRPLGLVEDTALLAAPNEFTKDLIESRLRPHVTDVLSRELHREVKIAVTVEPELAHDGRPPSSDGFDDELDAETLAADAAFANTLPAANARYCRPPAS